MKIRVFIQWISGTARFPTPGRAEATNVSPEYDRNSMTTTSYFWTISDPHASPRGESHSSDYVISRSEGVPACFMFASGGVVSEGYVAGLASAWAMARVRPKVYRPKVDTATLCSRVCPQTWPETQLDIRLCSVSLVWLVTKDECQNWMSEGREAPTTHRTTNWVMPILFEEMLPCEPEHQYKNDRYLSSHKLGVLYDTKLQTAQGLDLV